MPRKPSDEHTQLSGHGNAISARYAETPFGPNEAIQAQACHRVVLHSPQRLVARLHVSFPARPD